MVAPIEEVAAEEIEIDDDGEGAGVARAEPHADGPGDEPPPPQPREVRPSAIQPGAEIVRPHNLTHCPYQSWCEVRVAPKSKSDHFHREAPQSMDGDVARIQMDFMFVGAEGTFVDEPRARATVLVVICKDDGNLSAILEYVRKYRDQDRWGAQHLEGYKLDETKQRLWHKRVLEVTKKLELWNVRMEQCRRSCERITWMCKIV